MYRDIWQSSYPKNRVLCSEPRGKSRWKVYCRVPLQIRTFLHVSMSSANSKGRKREFFFARTWSNDDGVHARQYSACMYSSRSTTEKTSWHTYTHCPPQDNEGFRKAAGGKISDRLAARHEKWNWTLLAIAATYTRDSNWSGTTKPQTHRFWLFYRTYESQRYRYRTASTSSFFRRRIFIHILNEPREWRARVLRRLTMIDANDDAKEIRTTRS